MLSEEFFRPPAQLLDHPMLQGYHCDHVRELQGTPKEKTSMVQENARYVQGTSRVRGILCTAAENRGLAISVA